jgi:hypothetical protein
MGFIDKIRNIDRRIIFLVVALAIIVPLVVPIGFPIQVSPSVRDLYNAVEQLPAGSRLLVSFDYGASTYPEIYPMSLALLRHCFKRGLKPIIIGLWPEGIPFAERALQVTVEEEEKVYGEDYANLGFKAGGIVVMQALGRSFEEAFPVDAYGTPLNEIPVMRGVRNYDNIAMVIDLSAGDPGIPAWIMIAQGRFGKAVGGGCTAVSAPQFFPYLQAGQLVGLMGGMKGAAEYETLIERRDLGSAGMDAQSIAHTVIVLFIIIGNATFFLGRSARVRDREVF